MFDLPHIASLIFDTPLMIYQPKLEQIIGVLQPRLSGQPIDLRPASASENTPRPSYEIRDGVAIVPVMGTLMHRGSWLEAASGMTSYETLIKNLEAAVNDTAAEAVMLEFDSGGGAAAGCFECASAIAALRGKKPVWAFVNESAFSAAYALASACDRIVLPENASVGSIGVITAHVDQSAQDRALGLQWTYIYAGARKADGHPHAPLNESSLASIQKRIDAKYDLFVRHVAKQRRMNEAAVRDTEADIFMANEAIAIGLADEVMSCKKALQSLTAAAGSSRGGIQFISQTSKERKDAMNPETTTDEVPEAPEAKAESAAAEKPAATSSEANDTPTPASVSAESAETAIANAVRADRQRAAAIVKRGVSLGVSMDFVQGLIMDGISADAASSQMLDRKAMEDPAATIQSSQTPESSAAFEQIPLEERCKIEWNKDSALRAEFKDNFNSYAAFKRAEARNKKAA